MRSRLALAALTVALLGPIGGAAAATPYDELPVGAPTTLPWWQHGRLHVGDTVIETKRTDIAARAGTTVVGPDADRRSGRPTHWSIVSGDRLVPLPMQATSRKPLVSADGHWVAWLEVRAPRTDAYKRTERYRVVLYDAQAGRVATSFRDTRRVAWEDGGNGIWLRTLANTGQLLLSQGRDGLQVLTPTGEVAYHGPTPAGVLVDGWPLGTMVFRSRDETSVYGSIDAGGTFTRAGSFEVSFAGTWAPDGSAYAYEDADQHAGQNGAFGVRTLDGTTVALQVPEDLGPARIVGWESEDSVVLWAYRDWPRPITSRLLRCSAGTGACEQVPDGPEVGAYATMSFRY